MLSVSKSEPLTSEVFSAWLYEVLSYCKKEPAECLGALFGAIGAMMLSQNQDYSKYGWLAFLVSNMMLIHVAKTKKMYGLLMVQLYFSYTSLNGIINYF